MLKNVYKIVGVALMVIMVLGTGVTAYADASECSSDASLANVYSPEFPDAYILVEKSSLPSTVVTNDESTVSLNAIDVTVFVEETYAYDEDGNSYISDSRLLSREEIDAIGIENFTDLDVDSANPASAATNSYGKLTITFSGTCTLSGSEVTCDLTGNAAWSGTSVFGGENTPAAGKDFLGITWSGQFSMSSISCVAIDSDGDDVTVTACDAVANAGIVWGFNERNGNKYTTNIDAKVSVYKNKMTGDGNTAEAVLKYIHTYQTYDGSVALTAGSDSVSATFELTTSVSNWSIVCILTGIPY